MATPSNEDIEAVIKHATSSRIQPVRDTRTQLFVGNLPYRVRWQDLKDLFRKAGIVLRADVSLGSDNRSRGYGTVLLATAEDAGRAVDMYNGYSWQGRILDVRLDKIPQEFDHASDGRGSSLSSAASSHGGPTRNLFVGNLPYHCQWQDLKDLFRQAGNIIRADVALGLDGRSRGFGTVSYATDADAERALALFDGYDYNGRTLKVYYDKFGSADPGLALDMSLTNPNIYPTPTSSHLELDYEHDELGNIRVASGPFLQASNLPLDFDISTQLRICSPVLDRGGRRPASASAESSTSHSAASLRSLSSSSASSTSELRVRSSTSSLSHTPQLFDVDYGPLGHRGSVDSGLNPNLKLRLNGNILPSSVLSKLKTKSTTTSPIIGETSPSVSLRRTSLSSSPVQPTRPISNASPTSSQQHHAHPGPISLPPPFPPSSFPRQYQSGPVSPVLVASATQYHHYYGVPNSPYHTAHYAVSQQPLFDASSTATPGHSMGMTLTPLGLPPITPSMPAFTFLGGPSSTPASPGSSFTPSYVQQHPLHQFYLATPPIPISPTSATYPTSDADHGAAPMPHNQLPSHLSRAMSAVATPLSPGQTMSPGLFWSRPAHGPVGAEKRDWTARVNPDPGSTTSSGEYFPPMPPGGVGEALSDGTEEERVDPNGKSASDLANGGTGVSEQELHLQFTSGGNTGADRVEGRVAVPPTSLHQTVDKSPRSPNGHGRDEKFVCRPIPLQFGSQISLSKGTPKVPPPLKANSKSPKSEYGAAMMHVHSLQLERGLKGRLSPSAEGSGVETSS